MNLRCLSVFLVLAACSSSSTNTTNAPESVATPVRFLAPSAPAALARRAASGTQAEAVFLALQAALPPKDAYDFAALSCSDVDFPGSESTSCEADGVRIDDREKAKNILDTLHAAGAEFAKEAKEGTSIATKTLHSTRDSLAFDDQANAPHEWVRNMRLEGKDAQDVMNAIAGAGVTEDDGTLFVICNKLATEPTCGFQRSAGAVSLDAPHALAVWNAFVHNPAITVLNASHFVFDGQALSFVGVQDTARPPSP